MYYVGVMSGTSLDGVDVVLCQIDTKKCILLEKLEYPMPLSLKKDILEMIKMPTTLEKVGEIDTRLGVLFYKAVNALLIKSSFSLTSIEAIGLHGQTLWHAPFGKYPFSMQLGNVHILSSKLNIKVVSDFRQKDIALGGQGAPFAPAFHEFLFGKTEEKIAVINIGGMANITILDDTLLGYDTGCGNVLLDYWINKYKNISYDKEGTWAKSGKVCKLLLDTMLKDEYFHAPFPKSTGREKFNDAWLEVYLKDLTLNVEDVQRTLLEVTALSISNEVLKFNRDKIILCGGGAKNSFLVDRIKLLLSEVEVVIAKEADYIEAMTFAWLAYKRIRKEAVNLKDVTGATKNTILGGVYE